MSGSYDTQITVTADTYSSSGAGSENTLNIASTGCRSRYYTKRHDFGNTTGLVLQTRYEDHPTNKRLDGVTPEQGVVFFDPTTGRGVEVKVGESPGRQWLMMSYDDWSQPRQH